MENKRVGQRRDVYYSQEGSRRRSFNKKPPRCSWQPAVPSWEKSFCKVVGALDWETLLDMKKFVHLYDNVVKWDDSAGEEAFQNAKKRFFAKMHGLPCDISMPDPDLYIDEVDWDSKVDPELLMDLEYRHSVPDMTANNEPVVIFGDSLLCNQGFSASGWGGGFEEDFKNATNLNLNNYNNSWEDGLCNGRVTATENGWGDFGNNAGAPNVDDGAMGAAGWPASGENTWSWNRPENQKKSKNPRGDSSGAWGTWDVKNGRKNHASRLVSSYRTSRYHNDEQTDGYAWRDGINPERAACF